MTNRKIEIVTLRTTSTCPDRLSCPGLHQITGMPGKFVIGKRVTDHDILAAFADHLGDDEIVTWAPDDVIPEV